MPPRPLPSSRRCRGFTYLVALFAVAVAGVMLASGSVVWQTEAQRAREQELLRVGSEFRRAIGLYYERSPGAVKRYPDRLEDLLLDGRYLSVQRYLRRIYRDPWSGEPQWGLVRGPGGSIMGVYSLHDAAPMKATGFDKAEQAFEGARSYADWKFVYVPAVVIGPTPTSPAR